MENLITFGSCLSRHIARSYKRLFWAEIVSSVYHNRSDYFVNSFISKSVATSFNLDDFQFTSLEAKEIYLNQTSDGIGKHKLDTCLNLIEALDTVNIDYIFIDNFMDVASKLAVNKADNSIFIRSHDIEGFEEKFAISNFISVDESVTNFQLIVDFFREKQPSSKIFFFNFPYNTYDDDNRKDRSLSFFNDFKRDDIFIIPPINIPKVYILNMFGGKSCH